VYLFSFDSSELECSFFNAYLCYKSRSQGVGKLKEVKNYFIPAVNNIKTTEECKVAKITVGKCLYCILVSF